ncbi:MAG: hypothetical protein QM662_11250 [Gordonia sp. (in: high G+C Gram-positive bacteria)]
MSTDPYADTPYDVELAPDGRVVSFVDNRTSHYIVTADNRDYTRTQAAHLINDILDGLAATAPAFGLWYHSGGESKAETMANVAYSTGRIAVRPEDLTFHEEYGLEYWAVGLWNEPSPEVNGALRIRLGNTSTVAALSLDVGRQIADQLSETGLIASIVECLDPVEITATRAGANGTEILYARNKNVSTREQ